VVVLGAGLTGVAIAHDLASRGRRVVLVGTRDDALDPGLGHVLVGPGIPYRDVALRWGRDQARQVWEGQRENGDRLRLFVEALRDGCDYRRAGGFLLAGDREEGLRLADSEDMLREDGFPGEFLDQYMLEARFDVTGFTAAYWAADDAELDPSRLRAALRDAAVGEGARAWPWGPEVTLEVNGGLAELETPDSRVRAPWAVVTAEASLSGGAGHLARWVRPLALPGLTLRTAPGAVLPSPARTADGAFAWQALGDGLRLAGRGPAPGGPDGADLHAMAARLARVPGSEVAWEAMAGASPDGLPVIGLVPGRPLAVALALGTLAGSYAFVAARWLAEAMASGRDPTPAPLRPDRFTLV
jgi:glycine/D-amino acid oxidase-like deaminating enzyme